ncbi:hypothetical protein B0H13DRAFT_2392880 [Mycena leptocephala]|nr:hypothetical protein B0H13DRAFT_2392880 [Mycena leptocephala]
MTTETASADIITKEWLKSGLAQGVNYMDFIRIHGKEESRHIILARALILSCIGAGVPVFFIYSIAIKPANSPIYTKNIVYGGNPDPGLDSSTGNATIFVEGFNGDFSLKPTVSATLLGFGWPTVSCTTLSVNSGPAPWTVVECPCSWTKIQSVSISILIPPETDGVFVYLCKGDNFPEIPDVQFSQGTSTLGNYYGDWGLFRGRLVVHTPLLRGSRLFGLLSWTKRRLMATGFEPTELYIPMVTGLQPLPSGSSHPRHFVTSLKLAKVRHFDGNL